MSARRHNAFTVVELLVVIGIIGVLAAILLPAVQMAREAARAATCRENLGQCSFAASEYANAKGFLPASRTANANLNVVLNWVYPVLPYLEQDALHKQILKGTIPSELPQMDVLICTSQAGFAIEGMAGLATYPASYKSTALSYVVNGGRRNSQTNLDFNANGVFIDKGVIPHPGQDKHRIEEIAKKDGTSNTLMLAETVNAQSYLVAPRQQQSQMLWFPEDPNTFVGFIGLNQDRRALPGTVDADPRYARPSSEHPGGFNVAMCDGSVHFMAENIDYRVYAVLMTSNGAKANDPDTPVATNLLPEPDWQSSSHANYPGVEF